MLVLASLTLTAALASGSQTPDVPPREREVLMEFFAATDGGHWKDNSGWGSDRPVCEWHGVFCGGIEFDASRPTVTWLSLAFNHLRGTVPASLGALVHLERLNLSGNELTGLLPEPLLARWDAHAFELDAMGTRFSNMVVTAMVTVASTGVLCSPTNDLHFTATYDAASMKATFESVRCARPTGRRTECVVRDGRVFDMERFSRALAVMNYDALRAEYSAPFTVSTHQQDVTTTAKWGDGRQKTVKTSGREGPVEAWAAQQLFLSLQSSTDWERETRKPRCSFQR